MSNSDQALEEPNLQTWLKSSQLAKTHEVTCPAMCVGPRLNCINADVLSNRHIFSECVMFFYVFYNMWIEDALFYVSDIGNEGRLKGRPILPHFRSYLGKVMCALTLI